MTDFATFTREQLRPPPRDPIWQWAAGNVDFSLAQNYETPRHAPFDPDYVPYMRKVLDWCQDHRTREIWIRKCSRAGATEAVLCFLRWIVANAPRPTYYLTSDILTTERFMEGRIKRGFRTCPPANAYFRRARVTEYDIRFEHMDLRVSWPGQRGAWKQDGWACIVADEFDSWDTTFASDQLRKRAGTYRFHKILGLSSPEPKRGKVSGIVLEFDATDQCAWMMADPKTGNPFKWDFGGEGKSYGLKWPEDARDSETGVWDIQRVRDGAYYLTPDGTRIENSERLTVSATGDWVPQNPDAPDHVHGVWIVGPMTPFADGDFGILAARFLEAKRRAEAGMRTPKGENPLLAYFYENWAEMGDMPDSVTVESNSLRHRERMYGRGEKFFITEDEAGEEYDGPLVLVPNKAIKGLFVTADVQKYHIWWVARWWVVAGDRVDTGMEEWGNVVSFDDLWNVAEGCGASGVGVDIGGWGTDRKTGKVHPRFGETVDFCAATGALALKGEENMSSDIHAYADQDPSEGRRSSARRDSTYTRLTWNTDIFRSKLLAAMRGETPWGWWVPKMPGRPYVQQVLSTHKQGGEWVRKAGHPDDHMFDAECMQLVMARYDNLIA